MMFDHSNLLYYREWDVRIIFWCLGKLNEHLINSMEGSLGWRKERAKFAAADIRVLMHRTDIWDEYFTVLYMTVLFQWRVLWVRDCCLKDVLYSIECL